MLHDDRGWGMSDIKQQMAAYLNFHPDAEECTYVSYLMAVRSSPLNDDGFALQFFRVMCEIADQQDLILKRIGDMKDAAMNPPIVLKTMRDADVIEQGEQFHRAIELLEACSEDLFITNTDKELENNIDEFINEVNYGNE